MPLLRGRHPPDYTARGVFYGILIGLTPTVGIQMPIVFVIWLLLRSLNKEWDFNVIVGMAWVWLSNAFTVPKRQNGRGLRCVRKGQHDNSILRYRPSPYRVHDR